MYLIVENIGNTVAKDISIEVEPELKDSHNKDYEHLKEISFLPPNYQIKAFFDMGFNYLKKKTIQLNINSVLHSQIFMVMK